jgi:hypothetical protein
MHWHPHRRSIVSLPMSEVNALLANLPPITRRTNARAKRLLLRVRQDGIYLTMPPRVPEPVITQFLQSSEAWLSEHGVSAKLLEGRSMNTCENTRFSALLLQKKGGAPLVELVTDAYHMPRARRLFAINGVDTIPVVAPLPNTLTEWIPSRSNLMHSRRATYEAIATLRDLGVGETNCREIP